MLLTVLLHAASVVCSLGKESTLDTILSSGVYSRVYPGAVAMVGNPHRILHQTVVGSFGYENESYIEFENKQVTVDTYFDLASVSKVVATTTAAAVLYERGYYHLDDRVHDLWDRSFATNGKESITMRNLLLHNSGLLPDPEPWYWNVNFGCPNTATEHPAQDISCLDKIYDSLLNESVATPPGQAYAYSDIGFEVLQFTLAQIIRQNNLVQEKDVRRISYCSDTSVALDTLSVPTQLICYFNAFIDNELFSRYMPYTSYRLEKEEDRRRCAPTMNDTFGNPNAYTNMWLQGYVGDGDCYAMGGIAGHAGVFSIAHDVSQFLTMLLRIHMGKACVGGECSHPPLLNETTLHTFTTPFNLTQSSRALGWDTNAPNVTTYGFDHSCGSMSEATFMHIGYTGTCVCVDPVHQLWSVILTNRAFNCNGQLCPAGGSDAVKAIYNQYNTEIMNLYGQ